MDKNEKMREHIQILEKHEITFNDVITVFTEVITDVLDDDIVAFTYINTQGHIVGSDNVFPIETYIYEDGTLFRAFTQKTCWRLSAIRRKESGSVTFVEILAPPNTAEKLEEVAEYVAKEIKGIKVVV